MNKYTLKLSATALVVVLASTALNANAKGYKVDVPACDSVKGSIAVQNPNATAWSTLGANDPAQFLESMMVQSKCFTLASSAASADYLLVAGPITKGEYDAGPSSFSGQSSIAGSGGISNDSSGGGKALSGDLGKDLGKLFGKVKKMSYAYVDVTNTQGQMLARGFGRNNKSGLDYAHWGHNQNGIRAFHSDKKSLLAGGAMLNAFVETQKSVRGSGFGAVAAIGQAKNSGAASTSSNSGAGSSSNMGAAGGVFLSDIFDQRRLDKPALLRNYPEVVKNSRGGYKSGGRQVTVYGYANSGPRMGSNLPIAASERGAANPADTLDCILPRGDLERSGLQKGDRVSVSGILTAGGEKNQSDFGIGGFMVMWNCQINGAWDPNQLGGGRNLGASSVQVSATEIVSAFRDNEFGFNRKYNNKVVSITGPVSGVRQTERGVAVSMQDPASSGTAASFSCVIPGSQVDRAADLSKGDKVTFKGLVFEEKVSSLRNIGLKDCQLE